LEAATTTVTGEAGNGAEESEAATTTVTAREAGDGAEELEAATTQQLPQGMQAMERRNWNMHTP
jgi:hypothetical protein